MGRIAFSGDEKSIDEIWEWFEDQNEALNDFETKILSSVITGSNVKAKFIGFTLTDLNNYFIESKKELDKLVSLNIISATEAALRLDFLLKVYDKQKCDLSRKFREIEKAKENKISLEEDIIENWKEFHPEIKTEFSNLLGLLKYRHWLAHGRYWTPKLGQNFTANIVYDISDKIFEAIDK